jgi:hypothetical protein
MPIASGVFKKLAYKVEATYGTKPAATGPNGQALRRVESTLDLAKDTYQSNEIRPDMQVSDFRHGVRRVGGNIRGEISAKTYSDFFAALLRKDFTAVTALTGLSITIQVGSVNNGVQQYTITRATGDFLTGGIKIGDVIRLSAGTFNAANLLKNMLVLGVTATILTVVPLNGVAMVAEGTAVTGSTVTVVGKKTYVPTTSHTDKSFSIEHFYSDITQSEVFTGCKIAEARLSLPPTGIATADFTVQGQNVDATAAQYFTAPVAAPTSGVMAAVNGMVVVGGTMMSVITGLEITISGNYSGDPVVGSNVIPNVFPGRVTVSGQFTKYFDTVAQRDAFLQETEVAIIGVFTADNGGTADFVSFVMPRVKLGGATKNDGEIGLVETIPFTAIFNGAGGTGVATEQTTIVIQDSAA